MCFSHEEDPSVLDFELKSNSIFVKIQTTSDILFNDDAEKSDFTELTERSFSDRNDNKNLSSRNLRTQVFENWLSIKSNFLFTVDDRPLELELSDVLTEFSNSFEETMSIELIIEAPIPARSKFLVLGWTESYGDLVVRQQGDLEVLYTEYLPRGMKTSKIKLRNENYSYKSSKFLSYIFSGIYHIIPLGYDHILFILGLYFFAHHFRLLILQVSLFTVAHSISLALAVFEIINVPSSFVEPIIAASIVYIGLENYFATKKRYYRTLLIFGFGLLHGLGFANVLTSLEFTSDDIILPLLGFNIGVEIGQIIILFMCFVTFGYWFKNKSWYRKRIVAPFSGLLVLAGTVWFMERII